MIDIVMQLISKNKMGETLVKVGNMGKTGIYYYF